MPDLFPHHCHTRPPRVYSVNRKARAAGGAKIPSLFTGHDPADTKFRNIAQLRNACGDFFEEAAARLLRLTRLYTAPECDVCPDLLVDWGSGRRFVENKSVGRTGQAIIYQKRMEKDLIWTAQHDLGLCYLIWQHDAEATTAENLFSLRQMLAEKCRRILALPLGVLWGELKDRPTKTLNTYRGKKWGYGSAGYLDGWNLRLSRIAELCPIILPVAAGTVYGQTVGPLELLAHPDAVDFVQMPKFMRDGGI